MVDYTKMNPGIRKTVAWLRSKGFETTDSGDGETNTYECDRSIPYISIMVDPARMAEESNRLLNLLRDSGLKIGAMTGDITEPCIQATYDPGNKIAIIDLTGVKDSSLEDLQVF